MTSLVQALTGVTRLALDTAPIIYFVEEHPRYITRIAGASVLIVDELDE